MVIPVLTQLWGTPWNNAAVNFLLCLRPSYVRVTGREGVTADSVIWRVTVYLEKDNRTIRKIEQEVDVGLHGFRFGRDASLYLRGKLEELERRGG
jgi:hypothetical protein